MSKISNLSLSDVFLQVLIASKVVFGRGSAPDPAGGAYVLSINPLVGWRNTFSVSISVPTAPRFLGPIQTIFLAIRLCARDDETVLSVQFVPHDE